MREYWLFDPFGEWIGGQLRGYRLNEDGVYRSVQNQVSEVLGLRMEPGEGRLDLYRLDNGEKLLTLDELAQKLEQSEQQRIQTEQQRVQTEQELLLERQRAERLAAYLRTQGIDPDGM